MEPLERIGAVAVTAILVGVTVVLVRWLLGV